MNIEHKKRNFKYYINEDSYVFLQEWAERNKPLVEGLLIAKQLFSDKAVINLNTHHKDFKDVCYFTAKKDFIKCEMRTSLIDERFKNICLPEITKFRINFKTEKYEIKNEKGGFVDIEIPEGATQENIDMIKLFSSAFSHINAFMFYGNITDDNQMKAIKQNDNIFLKVFQEKLFAVPVSQHSIHKAPEGIFSVRGHFRKYKSGKIVWINEFIKGLNK